jgi:hypothetical protein
VVPDEEPVVPDEEPIVIPDEEPIVIPEEEPIVIPEEEPIVIPEEEPIVIPEDNGLRRILSEKITKLNSEEAKKSAALIKRAQTYITVHGMFELKYDQFFTPYNRDLNADLTTWVNYETSVRVNSFGL